MDPESKKYTIVLVLVVLLIAWYYSKSSNESFKSKRGLSKSSRSIGRRKIKTPNPTLIIKKPNPTKT
jgi:hypothetical protein